MKKTTFRNTLCKIAGAAALLAMSSTAAMAGHIPDPLPGLTFGQQFTINPTAVGEAACSSCNANYINFSYRAEVDQTNTTPTTASFLETGGGFFDAFLTTLGDPSIIGTGMNEAGGYRLYFLFSAAGTTTANAGIEGTFNVFNYSVYVDKDMDTTLTAAAAIVPGGGASVVVTGGGGEDALVLTGTLIAGGFHIFPGLTAGDFDVITTANPVGGFFGGTAFSTGGQAYADINGVNTTVTTPVAGPFATQTDLLIQGSGNTSFAAVPEPASLALFGLALAGLGFTRRSKKA